jgi:hypothetical protein
MTIALVRAGVRVIELDQRLERAQVVVDTITRLGEKR